MSKENDSKATDYYIGIEEAAEYLGVKASTIRTWIKNKNLPAHKIGGKLWKFKRSEIDSWVESGRNDLDLAEDDQ